MIFCAFIFYYSVEEFLEIKKHRLAYFFNVWNCLDLIVLIVSMIDFLPRVLTYLALKSFDCCCLAKILKQNPAFIPYCLIAQMLVYIFRVRQEIIDVMQSSVQS